MKKLITLLCSLFLLTLTSFGATVYHVASFSGIIYGVNQNGTVKMTPVTSHALLTAVAANSHLPISDYAVAVQEVDGHTAGAVVILQVKGQNPGAQIVTVIGSAGGTFGDVLNSAANDHYVVLPVTIDLPTGVFQGSVLIHTKGGATGIHTASYSFNGGLGNLVVKGTVILTGRKYTF